MFDEVLATLSMSLVPNRAAASNSTHQKLPRVWQGDWREAERDLANALAIVSGELHVIRLVLAYC